MGPLAGVRSIELAGLGPGPFAGMMLVGAPSVPVAACLAVIPITTGSGAAL